MNKQDIINSARMLRQGFKSRRASMNAKAAGVFALSYLGGVILSSLLLPILNPFIGFLSFLSIPLYAGITVLTLLFATLFTYPILVLANRQFRTKDE